MKHWPAILLLVLSTIGTFTPCCAIDGCAGDDIQASKDSNESHPEKEVCSPFFACATCSGFTNIQKPLLVVQPVAEKQQHHELIITFNYHTFSSSFWQPPRFVI